MEGTHDKELIAKSTISQKQAAEMIKTRECPRCHERGSRGKLYTRECFNKEYQTRHEFFEMYCIGGHSFILSAKELMGVKK